ELEVDARADDAANEPFGRIGSDSEDAGLRIYRLDAAHPLRYPLLHRACRAKQTKAGPVLIGRRSNGLGNVLFDVRWGLSGREAPARLGSSDSIDAKGAPSFSVDVP